MLKSYPHGFTLTTPDSSQAPSKNCQNIAYALIIYYVLTSTLPGNITRYPGGYRHSVGAVVKDFYSIYGIKANSITDIR